MKVIEGWGRPAKAKRDHYFVAYRSLCDKWTLLGEGVTDKKPQAGSGCRECWEKLEVQLPTLGDLVSKTPNFKSVHDQIETPEQDRINRVVEMISLYGGYDGGHHKQWLIDQTLRTLLGEEGYKEWRGNREAPIPNDDDADSHYREWDEGVAP